MVHGCRSPRLRGDGSPLNRTAARTAGIIAGGVALSAGAAVAAFTRVVSPIDAVGSEVIDRAPRWLKELAISWFGTNDKLALRIGIVVILAIIAALVGPHRRASLIAFAALGVVGALASAHRPNESIGAVVPSLLGATLGAVALHRWLRPRPIEVPSPSQAPLGWDRRRFLATSTAATAAAADKECSGDAPTLSDPFARPLAGLGDRLFSWLWCEALAAA